MSEELQELQRRIVGAVQQELTRFSGEVATNLANLEEQVVAGAAARAELEDQVRSLASALEHAHAVNSTYRTELHQALESRLGDLAASNARQQDEMSARLGRVVDEANVGIIAAVQSAAGPLVKGIEDRQEAIESEVRDLDGSIRRFDDQAGQMVDHINQVTSVVEARLERISSDVAGSIDEKLAVVVSRVDEVSAAAARHQAEVSNIVSSRVDASEKRSTERIMGLETRLSDEIGTRVADIDAHVGRVGAGLDDAVITLSDRIAKADARFGDVESQFATIRAELANVDAEAIDEMKDQVSSALGQAELVRIEMERFQEAIREQLEATTTRLVEIETTVNDQSMDVEMSVQLERLEEVERAVLMLDPDVLGHDGPEPETPVVVDAGVDPHDMIAMLDRFEAPASAPLAPPSAAPEHLTDGGAVLDASSPAR